MKQSHKKNYERLVKKRQKIKNYEKWALLIGIIILTIYLFLTNSLEGFVRSFGNFGILGIFLTGFFLGYTFTVVPAIAIILYFTNIFNPLLVAFIASVGKMFGDYLIFHYFKRDLPYEIEEIIDDTAKIKFFKKKRFHWIIPAIAGLVLLSPLPDEIALSFLGIIKFDTKTFMFFSFILNFIGLLILAFGITLF